MSRFHRIALASLAGLACTPGASSDASGGTGTTRDETSTAAESTSGTGDTTGETTGSSTTVASADGSTGSNPTESSEEGTGDSSGSTGNSPPRASCLPGSFVDSLSEPFSCEAMPLVTAPLSMLPFDCHTQGIGYDPGTGRVVVTCQDQDGGSSGRVLSFPGAEGGAQAWQASAALEVYIDDDTPHPSAIQIDAAGNFVVAMARGSASGPSILEGLSMAEDGALSMDAISLSHRFSHIGATAQANLDGMTVLLGCGWDCATLSVYTAPRINAASGFSLAIHASTEDFVVPGVDENVGAYNSLYLTERCEDGQSVLVATHEDWMDVWEVDGLGTSDITMSKVANRQIDEDVVQWQGRPIFYEGMTLEVSDAGVWVWAAPHDFGTEQCPAGTRCMQYVYRCGFGA